VKQGASDLHITAGMPSLIRVDRDIRRINVPAMDHKEEHALIYEIMNDKQRNTYEEFLETDFPLKYPTMPNFELTHSFKIAAQQLNSVLFPPQFCLWNS
tara:strand:+ start:28 stop:324 length:297 start_codon:yes stop_codon:yes gene_type:complete